MRKKCKHNTKESYQTRKKEREERNREKLWKHPQNSEQKWQKYPIITLSVNRLNYLIKKHDTGIKN